MMEKMEAVGTMSHPCWELPKEVEAIWLFMTKRCELLRTALFPSSISLCQKQWVVYDPKV